MSGVATILTADADTYERKARDYAPSSGDPWENFRAASDFSSRVCAGLRVDDHRRATATLIGIKISRLMTLGLTGHANNEAVEDTLKDLRVYAAILEAQNTEEQHGIALAADVEQDFDDAFSAITQGCP